MALLMTARPARNPIIDIFAARRYDPWTVW